MPNSFRPGGRGVTRQEAERNSEVNLQNLVDQVLAKLGDSRRTPRNLETAIRDVFRDTGLARASDVVQKRWRDQLLEEIAKRPQTTE